MKIHLFGVKCQNINLHIEKALLHLLLMLILNLKDSYHSTGSRAVNSVPIVSNSAPAVIVRSSPETCTNHLKLFLSD